MNLNKHQEFFDPNTLTDEIHIIGCGAVGSTIAELLTRLGCQKLHLYDFDKVSAHNITNQMFWHKHIGMQKLDALKEILTNINPEIKLILHEKGWTEQHNLTGYVFIAVDNIDLRKQIIKSNQFNVNIKAAFDVRIRLIDAQHFAARWTPEGRAFLLETMNFTRAEAQADTPMSACGTTLSVTPTVRHICSAAVSNFINLHLQQRKFIKTLLINTFTHTMLAFDEEGNLTE